jgi:hypothetical protein
VHPHDVCACAGALGCTTANKTRGMDRAVRFDIGDTTVSTGVSAPACSPTRACACVHRLDKKNPPVRPLKCVRSRGQVRPGKAKLWPG